MRIQSEFFRSSLLGFGLLASISGSVVIAQSSRTNPSPTPHPIDWTRGPFTAKLGDSAEIEVPKDFLFADGNGARKYLELAHNPVSNQEVGVIAPKSEKESWFVIFEFDDVGYVKDDDGSSLDSKAILESIQRNTEDANDYRKQKGWAAFHVTDWQTAPFYDKSTRNLTWAVNGQEDNGANKGVNYSVRILGRRGTMNVDLILDPQDVSRTVPVFNSLMSGFHFVEGHRYIDFAPGDKLAGYGLTALIAGGTGAVLVKTGLFAKFWKVIVALFVAMWKFLVILFAAVAARFKKIWAWFTGLFSKKKSLVEAEDASLPHALSNSSAPLPEELGVGVVRSDHVEH